MISTVSQPALMQAAAPAQPRIATAVLQGVRLSVPCPRWCVVRHAEQPLRHLSDLEHRGAVASLPVGGTQALAVHLAQWPFSSQPEPYLAAEASGDDMAEHNPTSATAFADQLVALADEVRRMAATLGGAA